MGNRTNRQAGFTLVEILIVVVILGILAAIVIPQFTNASESARTSSLYTQLQTIRSQLELYQVQHNGNYPDLSGTTAAWGPMTAKSDEDFTGTDEDSDGGNFGPYLQQPPVNPFTNASAVVQVTGVDTALTGGSDTDGWVYNQTTGEIIAVGFDEDAGTYTAPGGSN